MPNNLAPEEMTPCPSCNELTFAVGPCAVCRNKRPRFLQYRGAGWCCYKDDPCATHARVLRQLVRTVMEAASNA